MTPAPERAALPGGWSVYQTGDVAYLCHPRHGETFMFHVGRCKTEYRDLLSALVPSTPDAAGAAAGGGVAAGWRLVPVEPTQEMLEAIRQSASVNGYGPRGGPLLWAETLAASPAHRAEAGAGDPFVQDTTWFWEIVDRDGVVDVPSDVRGALALLCEWAKAAQPRPAAPAAGLAGVEAAEEHRQDIARLLALHGLGTRNGLDRHAPPNDTWERADWERRILECVPEAVEVKCLAVADAVLAHLAARDREVDGLRRGGGEGDGARVPEELRRLSEAATPGLWTTRLHGLTRSDFAEIDAPGWLELASVTVQMEDEFSRSVEGLANLKLIAASVNDLRFRLDAEDRARPAAASAPSGETEGEG